MSATLPRQVQLAGTRCRKGLWWAPSCQSTSVRCIVSAKSYSLSIRKGATTTPLLVVRGSWQSSQCKALVHWPFWHMVACMAHELMDGLIKNNLIWLMWLLKIYDATFSSTLKLDAKTKSYIRKWASPVAWPMQYCSEETASTEIHQPGLRVKWP